VSRRLAQTQKKARNKRSNSFAVSVPGSASPAGASCRACCCCSRRHRRRAAPGSGVSRRQTWRWWLMLLLRRLLAVRTLLPHRPLPRLRVSLDLLLLLDLFSRPNEGCSVSWLREALAWGGEIICSRASRAGDRRTFEFLSFLLNVRSRHLPMRSRDERRTCVVFLSGCQGNECILGHAGANRPYPFFNKSSLGLRHQYLRPREGFRPFRTSEGSGGCGGRL
jgi:hypothetical protein